MYVKLTHENAKELLPVMREKQLQQQTWLLLDVDPETDCWIEKDGNSTGMVFVNKGINPNSEVKK